MMKRIFISIGLFLAILAIQISAQTAVAPSVGDGSAGNPYQISSLNNLYWLTQQENVSDGANNYWTEHYIQTADIDASSSSSWDSGSGFSPIGTAAENFTGTYNGDGHTITGIYIDRYQGLGLFGVTGDGAIIENVGVLNVDITGSGGKVGAVVGELGGSDNKVINCYSTGVDSGYAAVGGLVGYTSPGDSIKNCHSSCDVRGNASTGGLVGTNYAVILKSYATGNVRGAGGVGQIGGLVGYQYIGSEVNMCYATGNADGVIYVGGLVGRDEYGLVKNSYSRGAVTCSNDWIGGLISRGYYNEIDYSYATGAVSAPGDANKVGGLISNGSGTSVTSCFWDVNTTNQLSSDKGTGKTTGEMKSKSTFTNASWDFSTPIWRINEYLNDGYPYLSWQEFLNDAIDVPTVVSDSVFVLNGADIGFQSETNTVDVQFELKDVTPPDFPSGAPYVGVYWDITNVSGGSVKLRLYYYPEDISGFSGSPKIFHYDGSNWVELPTTAEMVDGDRRYVETTNYYSSYSPVTIGDGANPLPVELISFTGSAGKDGVVLNWETATEVNNYGYEVERQNSEPGTQNAEWEKIGFIQGSGTANSSHSYSFVDSDLPSTNKVDYRLKQIDNDGSITYSKIIEVDISTITDVGDKINYEFALKQNYPNPFNPTTTIKYSIAKQNKVELKVYDILGEEVKTLVNETEAPGNYEVKFDGSDLASGIYFDKLKSGNHVSIKKLMLVK